MKAITLWQPWASLIALGLKEFETRSWSTYYRGDLLIHAAARRPRLAECNPTVIATLQKLGLVSLADLPLGRALCVVRLVNIFPVAEVLARGWISPTERAYGDYAPGRYVWQLAYLRPLTDPPPMKGQQRLWIPADDEEILGRQYTGRNL